MKLDLTPEEESKDKFFAQIAELSQGMIEEHGQEFAMGALILAAQWIREGKFAGAREGVH